MEEVDEIFIFGEFSVFFFEKGMVVVFFLGGPFGDLVFIVHMGFLLLGVEHSLDHGGGGPDEGH